MPGEGQVSGNCQKHLSYYLCKGQEYKKYIHVVLVMIKWKPIVRFGSSFQGFWHGTENTLQQSKLLRIIHGDFHFLIFGVTDLQPLLTLVAVNVFKQYHLYSPSVFVTAQSCNLLRIMARVCCVSAALDRKCQNGERYLFFLLQSTIILGNTGEERTGCATKTIQSSF